ncbi:high light inducible protein [Microcoleus sp. FACHB-1515]|uniref:chlorophyll a/b-binding protein n=1 Tax=Cyanophyceae TaxID=3028117 RepID=UPI001684B124|nr:chlorophyll a/b-binding protein [Microcoleus sp. FACHB-1515]MBD2093101.1 high light inducible protein [Microcoleus sp. FACHB-1515]
MVKGLVTEEQGRLNNYAIEPKVVVVESQFGFSEYAEKLNGRLAMIGFVALVALEAVTGHGIIGFFQNL